MVSVSADEVQHAQCDPAEPDPMTQVELIAAIKTYLVPGVTENRLLCVTQPAAAKDAIEKQPE